MRRNTGVLLGAFLAFAGSAFALVKPEEGTALPDYDVRSTIKGLMLGSAPGKFRARQGNATAPALSQRQQQLMGELKTSANGDFVVRYNELTGSPKLLFRYQGALTGPDSRDASLVALGFLSDYADLWGFEPAAIDSFREVKRMGTRGWNLTIVQFEQNVGGVPVFGGTTRLSITADGEIAQVSMADPIQTVTGLDLNPALDPAEAVRFAAAAMGVTLTDRPLRINAAGERVARFEKGPFMAEPTAQAVLFPMGATARLGWMVHVERADVPASYEIVVDAGDGTLLYRTNLVNYAQTDGLVFPFDPAKGGQVPTKTQFYDSTVLVDPRWALGWADSNQSLGNVADSKEDWAGDNEGTIGQRSKDFVTGPPIFFEDPWTNSYETSGNAKRDVFFTITQLFYFANKYHDWLYPYGFDEPSGNWQRYNYGRGGKENDPILVDAQDSYDRGQRNNANMATPADGQSPRAQFFMFTAAAFAQRDSGVDADVVMHEFTHGLSHRLVGGGTSANCLNTFHAGSMGEGWADFYACAYADDPVMGEYATGNSFSGIRSQPYDAYPACHNFNLNNFCSPNSCAGFVPACEVHDEGQLWAAALWEMRMLLIAADPVNGADIALRLVTDGMKLTVCNPSMLDARDGILLADRYDYAGVHQCLIWEAFKDRYMGYSATVTSGDDTLPNGANDYPPFCQSQGRVLLDLQTYGCGDSLIATVQDRDPSGSVQVSLSATSGDTLTVTATGVAPIFSTGPVPIALGSPVADAILQVAAGDTITASYTDASPPNVAQMTAAVSCLANVRTELGAAGGCAPDASSWPGTIPEILDAGEIVEYSLIIYNQEPRELTNVMVSITGTSNPMVVPMSSAPAMIASIPPYTGSGVAKFRVGASPQLAAGTVTLDFGITADGFTGAVTAISHAVPVMSDYQVTAASTGVQDFEANDGGYTHYPWPYAAPTDDWRYPGCAAASGTKAWGAANASCSGFAAEQDSNLETALLNPVSATRVAWYPTALEFNHRLNIGTGGSPAEQVVIGLSEPNPTGDGDIAGYAILGPANNTGASFQPMSVSFAAGDVAGLQIENGLVFWWDFWTNSGSAASTEWIIDDVNIRYQAADAVSQTGAPTCIEAGYTGSVASCAGSTGFAMYNSSRPAEIQYAGNGRFWNVGAGWNMFDIEFPTPSSPGERLVFVASDNPDDGAHAGSLAVNGRLINNTDYLAFGNSNCTQVPTPTGPANIVAGQPLILTWPPFVESGNVPSVVGYRVYRLDAETYPAATSRISDYLNSGVLVGSSIGQGDINRFVDTAPPVATGTDDLFTYAIQPLLRCDGASTCPGGGGPVPLTFGGSESSAGTANLSTDSPVVRVSQGLLAHFDSYAAVRQGAAVKVTWATTSEIDTIGFNVYRGTSTDPLAMSKVNPKLVAGQGTQGGSYSFTDGGAPAGAVYYQIREVAASGQATRTDVFAAVEATGTSQAGGRRRSRGGAATTGVSAKPRSAEGRLR